MIFFFVIIIQRNLHLKSQRQRTLRLLFGDCCFIYFHSFKKQAFLLSKGLLWLYDKQNNTWLLVDMEFLFSCSTRHSTRWLRSLVSYRVKNSKRNTISTRAHVLVSISLFTIFFKKSVSLKITIIIIKTKQLHNTISILLRGPSNPFVD